ncbi:MAG: ABC transporter ATP-binding protein [Firmicutes bacterium]|nr:ABC transporter ATP-binding protein [Bacillota bacterium]
MLLKVNGVSKSFGGLKALNNVSVEVAANTIHSIVGPNGSGKTTLFNVVTGFSRPTAGTIEFKGEDITALRPSDITFRGLVRTFQNVLLFKNLTVLENVLVGRHCRLKAQAVHSVYRPQWVVEEEAANVRRARDLLELAGLAGYESDLAKNLSYGEQKRLELARALATDPKMVMLDEPAAGTTTAEAENLVDLLRQIRDMGKTILLIEHKMDMVMSISDRVSVLNFGTKIAEGSPAEVISNRQVIEAYLGKRWLDAQA